MLDAPYYLAAGDCVLEDGTGSGPYFVQGMSFPKPDPDGYGGWNRAVRSIRVKVSGTSASDLAANQALLVRELVDGKLLRFKPNLDADLGESRIYTKGTTAVEESSDPLRRNSAEPHTYLDLTITTEPHWRLPWSDDITPTVSAVPGHFDTDATIPGEDDALVRLRAIFGNNGYGAAVGVKPDPRSGYDYIDDYVGSPGYDANAFGTSKIGITATNTPTVVSAAPAIDTNDNRGLALTIARLDTDATTAANCSAYIATKTTGASYGGSTEVAQRARAFTRTDLVARELGYVQIPSGQVPDLATASGWTPEAAQVTQASDDGTLTLTSDASSRRLWADQTFAAFNGRVTAIEYTVDTAPSQTVQGGGLLMLIADGVATMVSTSAPTSVGTHKVSLPTPVTISSSNTVSFRLDITCVAQFTIGLAKGANRYASGALTTPIYGSGEAAGDDLVFKVYGELPTSFDTTNPVYVTCSESSKTVNIDYVQRIPLDYAAIVYRQAASGAVAFFYDGDTDTPYSADADGIGPAILDKFEIRKPLRLKPGVVNRVVLGCLQADEAVQGATVTYSYRPRYLSAVW